MFVFWHSQQFSLEFSYPGADFKEIINLYCNFDEYICQDILCTFLLNLFVKAEATCTMFPFLPPQDQLTSFPRELCNVVLGEWLNYILLIWFQAHSRGNFSQSNTYSDGLIWMITHLTSSPEQKPFYQGCDVTVSQKPSCWSVTHQSIWVFTTFV